MNNDLGVLREVWSVGGDGLERDELCLGNVGDLPFVFLADVDEKGVEVAGIEAGFEFFYGDGLHVGIGDLAAWVGSGFRVVYGGDGGGFSAEAASGIVGQFQGAEGGGESIVDKDFPERWLAISEDELDRFHGLQGADDAGEHSEDARFAAGRNSTWGGDFWKEATVAGATEVGGEDGHLAIEAVYGSVDERLFQEKRGIICQESGRKIVRSVEDDVVVLRNREGVIRGEADGMEVESDVGVGLAEAGFGGLEFCFSYRGVGMK